MTKVSKLVGAGTLLATAAGCNLLPPELQPPTTRVNAKPPQVEELADMMNLEVAVRLRMPGDDRSVLFNGLVAGALQNDITYLLVGVFDYGSTTAPSFGYIYNGAVGSAVAAALTAANTAAGATYAFMSGTTGGSIKSKIGTTAACSGCNFASVPETNANDKPRRYLVRNYGIGTGWSSGSTLAKFTNIPLADAAGIHKYVVFAAAYDNHSPSGTLTPQLLGYAEVKANNGSEQPAVNNADVPMTGALQLDLKLNEGLLAATKAMTQAPSLSVYVPIAGD
ncbi:MAG: hypothetical protein FJZ01_12250 [Candidatus Sericytochromatia bacterium]|nr:hypothetical protein [Candidatus Tanganyikabacteria bacterium]